MTTEDEDNLKMLREINHHSAIEIEHSNIVPPSSEPLPQPSTLTSN